MELLECTTVSILTGSALSMDEGAVVIVMMSMLTRSVFSMDEGGIIYSHSVHCDWFSLVHG